MPVRHSIIGRQRTISGLAKAVFDLKDDPELLKRAEAALLQANPGLADEGGVKPGAAIIVPDLRDPHTIRVDREPPRPAEAIRNVMTGGMALAGVAVARQDAAVKQAAESAKSLKTKATADAIAAVRPDLKDKLAAIAAEAEKEAKRAAEVTAKLRDAIGRIEGLIPGIGPR